ncbi:MAG: hypothetical protein ACFFG0_03025 [Candidatus Thorarchaeota archaeon]
MGLIRRKRIKYAFKFGKLEHKAGRILGWYLFLSSIIAYFFISLITFVFLICGLIIWCVYILSHTFEKKLFGKHGPRNSWGKRK